MNTGEIIALIIAAITLLSKFLKSSDKDERTSVPRPKVTGEPFPPFEESGPRTTSVAIADPLAARVEPDVFSVDVSDMTESQAKAREPIDKKKLIVYSEIMKPKYLD